VAQRRSAKGEIAFIDWLRRRPVAARSEVCLGPGDDCALVRAPGVIALTIDTLLEGVHFPPETPARLVGRKAAAVSLSDVAAMGMRPLGLLLAAALPEGWSMARARALFEGARKLAADFGAPIVGGDVTSWRGRLVLTTTVFGREGPGRPVRRSGARPGQRVLVTGTLGASLETGKHLRFTPRVHEALELVGKSHPTAMIDVSDGLARDLWHITRESGVGAVVDAPSVPIASALRRGAKARPREALRRALSDGEDFELLFTLPARLAAKVVTKGLSGTPVTDVGEIVRGGGLSLRWADGSVEPLEPLGYEHFRGGA
jgi:thiamine-monophosphate kinase